MKKIIKLNESDLLKIINRVISEQIIQGVGNDPYQYKKVGNNYFYAFKGKSNWTQAKNPTGLEAIKTKIFQEPPTSRQGGSVQPKKVTTSRQGGSVQSTKVKSRLDIPGGVSPSDTPEKIGDTRATPQWMKQLSKDAIKTQTLIRDITQRSFNVLTRMKKENYLQNDSFVIVNKNQAVISLFKPNYKFIATGRIVYGGATEKPGEYKDYGKFFDLTIKYCNVQNGISLKKGGSCDKVTQYYAKFPKAIGKRPPFDFPDYPGWLGKGFPYSFEASVAAGENFTPSGDYDLAPGSKGGYSKTGSIDKYNLRKDGKTLPTAVHLFPSFRKGHMDKISKTPVSDDKDVSSQAKVGMGCINIDERMLKLFDTYKPTKCLILPENKQDEKIIVIPTQTFIDKLKNFCVNSFTSLSSLFNDVAKTFF